MKKVKIKPVFVNTYIVLFIVISMLSPVFASSTSEKIHRHYIAKTLQMSSGEHTVKGGVIIYNSRPSVIP